VLGVEGSGSGMTPTKKGQRNYLISPSPPYLGVLISTPPFLAFTLLHLHWLFFEQIKVILSLGPLCQLFPLSGRLFPKIVTRLLLCHPLGHSTKATISERWSLAFIIYPLVFISFVAVYIIKTNLIYFRVCLLIICLAPLECKHQKNWD
jgi:hypothetical protein